jgi:transcriptional regulator with XRE-family HTH domain
MEQPTVILAQNLRALREERNLSLAKLAELTGVSKSMLRQIETGRSSPTIATLWKIANGLHVPFTALLRKQELTVTRRAFKEGEPLVADAEGYRLFPLILFDPHRPFETYYVEIDPGTTLDADPHPENTEEHVFALRGQIDITIGDTCHTVDRDHFVSFSANAAHRYRNSGEEMAVAIMLISYQS